MSDHACLKPLHVLNQCRIQQTIVTQVGGWIDSSLRMSYFDTFVDFFVNFRCTNMQWITRPTFTTTSTKHQHHTIYNQEQ